MIEGIYNSEKSLPETGGVSFLPGTAGSLDANAPSAQKSSDSSPGSDSDSYSLSFSDKAWEILGSDKAKNEKDEKDGKDGKKERDLSGKEELSDDDKRKVEELKKIDRNVHVHEEAHLNAAGGYARGGANYSYVTGPDGKRYANAGSVNLDTSPETKPEATIRKANVIRRAALAPADPSPSDRQIASEAVKMEQEAQMELAAKQRQGENASASADGDVSASADGDVSVVPGGSTAA